MKTNNNNSNETRTAANMAASNNQQNAAKKIDDFGQKIGGARKDLYQAAREWAEKLADITADQLAAVGVSKLVRLPNLESMTAAGAITAQQARAALVVWRSIEAKPAKSWRVSGWAERTREKLDIIAALLTADNAADIAETLSEAPEFRILTAANWPAEAFTFGRYSVSEYQGRADYYGQSAARYFRIYSGRYSVGEKSGEAANIAAQLREMTARDVEKQAESRARGPRLGVYHTSDHTRYFIAVENKCEIVLKVCDTYQEAAEAVKNERAELLARYEDLKTFPALRRSWNRPRVGKVWHAEDVTPEQFAAVLPFKGVEFGNWLRQQERAALLNSAFDGFHDLADLLGIPAEAVALGGRLNFSFATRGHAGSAAHFETAYNTININKRNGAGCMAHEWLHACDHYAAVLAGRGAACSWGSAFATEYTGEPTTDADRAAAELVAVIRSMDYYTRSQNYQAITGKSQGGADYYTQPCELAARGFEGVMLYLLTKAGACSDFLVNLETWKDFEMNDKGHRRDCYPYPSDAEAAALLPYYIKFFRALFGRCEVSKEAAEGVAAATLQAEQEKQEADRRAAEKAEQERKESEARRAARRAELERKAEEQRKENERKAAEVKAKAEATRAAIVERLTAAHFDSIATDCDAAAVYFAAHLYGEIYTGKAEIKSDPADIAATIEAAPLACVSYKYIHNAKRIICRRWQGASIRSNKRTARELVESLQAGEVRQVVRTFADFEQPETWQKAAERWADTERLHEEQARRHQEAAERAAVSEPTESKPAEGEAVSVAGNGPEGLQLVTIPGGVAVVGTADTEKARGRQTYRARREIKAHGAQWNHAANQWQATDPDIVARLREWFGLSDTPAETVSESESESTAPAVAPTLEQGGEITAAERLGEAVREWAANDYAATHHGATLTDWDKQHPAPVEWCNPGQVFKMNREIAGREIYAIVTKLGGDCFFYVGNFGNNNEHLSAYNCQRWENLQPVEVMHEDAPKFAAMFAKFHSIREAWEKDGAKIWQEREEKERAAAVVVPTLQQAEEISEPAAIAASDEEGAPVIDTAAAFAPDIVAQAMEAHPEWPAEFFTADFFEREATDEHGHRIKKHSEIKEQARRLECNYFAGRGGYRDAARRLERTKGAQHPDTLKAYERLQSRARLVRAAELEAYRQAGEARRAAYYRTAPTSPAAAIVAASLGVVCHSYKTGAPVIESREITAPADLAAIIETAKQQESRTASGLNYGPIVYLRNNVLYADNGRTTAENMKEYEANLKHVTTPNDYAGYLLSSYDVFVDETQVFCDLRRAFPSLKFREICKLIGDHMGENQQGDGIALALVPDYILLQSEDQRTREKFRERHEKFYRLSSFWKGEEVNTERENDLRRHFDPESLALHFILSEELYYLWSDDRAANALERVREVYPEMTAEQIRDIYERYRRPVSDLYD